MTNGVCAPTGRPLSSARPMPPELGDLPVPDDGERGARVTGVANLFDEERLDLGVGSAQRWAPGRVGESSRYVCENEHRGGGDAEERMAARRDGRAMTIAGIALVSMVRMSAGPIRHAER